MIVKGRCAGNQIRTDGFAGVGHYNRIHRNRGSVLIGESNSVADYHIFVVFHGGSNLKGRLLPCGIAGLARQRIADFAGRGIHGGGPGKDTACIANNADGVSGRSFLCRQTGGEINRLSSGQGILMLNCLSPNRGRVGLGHIQFAGAVDGNGIVGVIAAVAYNIIGADRRGRIGFALQAQAQAVDGIAAYQYAGSRRFNCKDGVGFAKLALGLLYCYGNCLGIDREGVGLDALRIGAGHSSRGGGDNGGTRLLDGHLAGVIHSGNRCVIAGVGDGAAVPPIICGCVGKVCIAVGLGDRVGRKAQGLGVALYNGEEGRAGHCFIVGIAGNKLPVEGFGGANGKAGNIAFLRRSCAIAVRVPGNRTCNRCSAHAGGIGRGNRGKDRQCAAYLDTLGSGHRVGGSGRDDLQLVGTNYGSRIVGVSEITVHMVGAHRAGLIDCACGIKCHVQVVVGVALAEQSARLGAGKGGVGFAVRTLHLVHRYNDGSALNLDIFVLGAGDGHGQAGGQAVVAGSDSIGGKGDAVSRGYIFAVIGRAAGHCYHIFSLDKRTVFDLDGSPAVGGAVIGLAQVFGFEFQVGCIKGFGADRQLVGNGGLGIGSGLGRGGGNISRARTLNGYIAGVVDSGDRFIIAAVGNGTIACGERCGTDICSIAVGLGFSGGEASSEHLAGQRGNSKGGAAGFDAGHIVGGFCGGGKHPVQGLCTHSLKVAGGGSFMRLVGVPGQSAGNLFAADACGLGAAVSGRHCAAHGGSGRAGIAVAIARAADGKGLCRAGGVGMGGAAAHSGLDPVAAGVCGRRSGFTLGAGRIGIVLVGDRAVGAVLGDSGVGHRGAVIGFAGVTGDGDGLCGEGDRSRNSSRCINHIVIRVEFCICIHLDINVSNREVGCPNFVVGSEGCLQGNGLICNALI